MLTACRNGHLLVVQCLASKGPPSLLPLLLLRQHSETREQLHAIGTQNAGTCARESLTSWNWAGADIDKIDEGGMQLSET